MTQQKHKHAITSNIYCYFHAAHQIFLFEVSMRVIFNYQSCSHSSNCVRLQQPQTLMHFTPLTLTLY